MNRHGMPFAPGGSLKKGGVIRKPQGFASARQKGRSGNMTPSRALLHLARVLDQFLFYPTLAAVIWGELTGKEPAVVGAFNDKFLHFMAYFALAAMAAAALKRRRPVVWACFGLMLLGGVLEIVQGFTGRDMSAYDELANMAGVVAGGVTARGCVEYLRRRSV
jgi:VanZ family protein